MDLSARTLLSGMRDVEPMSHTDQRVGVYSAEDDWIVISPGGALFFFQPGLSNFHKSSNIATTVIAIA